MSAPDRAEHPNRKVGRLPMSDPESFPQGAAEVKEWQGYHGGPTERSRLDRRGPHPTHLPGHPPEEHPYIPPYRSRSEAEWQQLGKKG